MKEIVLTGIKPTGIPHIGNYFGAIVPAIELAKKYENAMFFLADYHALNTIKDAKTFKENCLVLASTWLACGIDKTNTIFYRQSDIPEIFELNWIISNVTSKGLLNRAHAYKAAVQNNIENGDDPDFGINMGLYNYPVLMAADILIMNSNFVPVGLDQKQHVEIARDIASSFNSTYGNCFELPQPLISETVGTLPGLDGRKMSKSYNNVISLFSDENTLKKQINKIVTNSKLPGEEKDPDCLLFKIYSLFASEQEIEDMKIAFKNGIGWGDAKKATFEVANKFLSPMREKYNYYISHPEVVEEILQKGAEKARKIAQTTLQKVRKLIGKN